MIYINILLIATILVIVTDISDFPNTIKHLIWKWLKPKSPYREYRLHLIDCSFCQTWWASLICILVMGELHLYTLAFALFVAFLTPVINIALHFIYDFFVGVFNVLYRLLGL